MTNKIIFYCDASYRDGKCGYAIMYYFENKQDEAVFIYGKCQSTTSTEAELIAVIKTLEYIIQYLGVNEDYRFELGIDEFSIFNFIIHKIYKRFNTFGWKDSNGQYKKSNVELWQRFVYLYELFPKGTLKLKKVKSRVNPYNRKVDAIAGYIINKQIDDKEECSFIVKNSDYKSIIFEKAETSIIEIKRMDVDKSAQNFNKNVNWTSLLSTNKIEYILVDDILVTEQEHLKCRNLDFNGGLLKIKKENRITTPIVVKRLDEYGKYTLVAGVKRLFSAKILGIKIIPVIISELGHKEFVDKFSI